MSSLQAFLNQVKKVITHYGITYDNEIAKFGQKENIVTYYFQTSSGMIFITVDLTTFKGEIQFNTLFQSSNPKLTDGAFSITHPALIKYQQEFNRDKEIFNAFVTQHDDDYTMKKTYGCLLDLLDVSLVLKVSIDDKEIDENSFVIRYHTLQSCSKMLMLDSVYYLQFENSYDFEYVDGKIIYGGDYEDICTTVSEAYHLNDPYCSGTNFKDLAQLTLMKIY